MAGHFEGEFLPLYQKDDYRYEKAKPIYFRPEIIIAWGNSPRDDCWGSRELDSLYK